MSRNIIIHPAERHLRSLTMMMATTKTRRSSWSLYMMALCGLYCVYTICVTFPSSTLRNLRVIHQDLEFVHITKTGGTTIERVGCENGYKWGSMHYSPYFGCNNPDVDPSSWMSPQLQQYTRVSPWHTPPKILKTLVADEENPFIDSGDEVDPLLADRSDDGDEDGKNGTDTDAGSSAPLSTHKKLFTIVRNPYTRFVSEYYCPFAGYRGENKHDPAVMNEWMQAKIADLQIHRNHYVTIVQSVAAGGGDPNLIPRDVHPHAKHFLNQVDYVYDDESGNKIIDHVLHYENMEEEFNNLMKRYKLGMTLPKKEEMDTYGTKGPKLTYRDLDAGSIEKINQWAGADFVAFGYKIITEYDNASGQEGQVEEDYDPDLRPLANYDPSPRSGMCDEFLWVQEAGNCTRIDE